MTAEDFDGWVWRLEMHADDLDRAKRNLTENIRSASAAGLSLRAIADAAGVSHEKVRQILRG